MNKYIALIAAILTLCALLMTGCKAQEADETTAPTESVSVSVDTAENDEDVVLIEEVVDADDVDVDLE